MILGAATFGFKVAVLELSCLYFGSLWLPFLAAFPARHRILSNRPGRLM
jgi:hypothetical protein